MNPFLLALIPPFLYSISNLIDKNLLSRYFKDGGAGTLILFSSLFAGLVAPVFYFIEPSVTSVTLFEIGILGIAALLDVALLWFFFAAIEKEEPSVVIAYYQLVPVMGLILGYLILGEVVSFEKLRAAGVILLGTTIISFKFTAGKKVQFRTRTTLLMVGACACWALGNVLFKYVALDADLWRSLFWKHVGFGVIGTILFLIMHTYRASFIRAMKKNTLAILSLNVFNETIYVIGSSVSSMAQLLTQVAIVQLANTYQHLFVLGLGVLITVLARIPRLNPIAGNIVVDHITRRHLIQSLFAIVLAGVGTYMLITAS